jgi:hypothetical protein
MPNRRALIERFRSIERRFLGLRETGKTDITRKRVTEGWATIQELPNLDQLRAFFGLRMPS